MASATLSISAVWDRTTQQLGRQGGKLALLALVTLGVNDLLTTALQQVVAGASPVIRAVGVGVIILAVLWGLVGQIAITSLALDREVAPGAAIGNAIPRMPAMIGATLLLVLGAAVLALPLIGAFVAGAVDLASEPPVMPAWFIVYMFGFFIVALCLAVKLLLIGPMIVDGAGPVAAIRGSFTRTRGCFWRILAVLILYLIVVGVVALAVESAAGIIFKLVLGDSAWLATAVVGAIVSSVLQMVALVFCAKLYQARDTDSELRERFV